MKVICIGRNYLAHAKELNNDLPKEPIVFIKPDSSILQKRNPFYIPEFSSEIHYEVELVLKIKKIGKHIEEKFSHKYYDEIGLGIDFTARDLQEECKNNGLPWEKAKAFDGSCVVGNFYPVKSINDLDNIRFRLEKNGVVVQDGASSNMIFNMAQIISYVSKFFTLKIGDLIFTGTPAGVGPVAPGDQLIGFLEDHQAFKLNIK